jgi:hypothetical protein
VDALTVITLLVAVLFVVGFVFWLLMGLAIFLGAATMDDLHDDFPRDKDFENRKLK